MNLRAPITGFVLVAIVVMAAFYGYQAAFGGGTTVSAEPDCDPTTPTSSTTSPSPPTGTVPAGTVPGTTATTPTGAPGFLLPANVTVNVYNATARRGLAINTAAILKDRGFDVDNVDNDPLEETIVEVAKIRAARADLPEVRLLIQHIPGAVVVADRRTTSTVDLVLGDAFTVLGPVEAVTPVPLATTAPC